MPTYEVRPVKDLTLTASEPDTNQNGIGISVGVEMTGYLATVQFTGSLLLNVATIPVARNIASAEMTTGRKVAVAFFDRRTTPTPCSSPSGHSPVARRCARIAA